VVGHIKLHRSIINWEWFDDEKTLKLFLYLLIKASWKNKKWKGMTVLRGELFCSIESLANGANLSIQEVRSRLINMQTSGEITRRSTNKYTVITICNYDDYQAVEIEDNKQPNKPTTNQQQHLKKENKEKKEEGLQKVIDVYIKMKADSTDEVYRSFVDFILGENPTGEPLDACLSFVKPYIKEGEFKKLINDFPKQLIKDKLLAINNDTVVTKKRRILSSTLINWCKREQTK